MTEAIEKLATIRIAPPLIGDTMTLDEILNVLDLHDQGLVILTDEQTTHLLDLLVKKVDACKFKLDSWEDDVARHASYAAEHIEASNVIKKKAKQLEERIVWAMQRNGFEKLPGSEYSLEIYVSPGSLDIIQQPTPEHAAVLPELVEVIEGVTTYKWKNKEVKEAIRNGMADFPFGRIVKKVEPQFKLNRKDK